MASRDDVYRRIPSGAAIHQQQQQQHHPQHQQHHPQQHAPHPQQHPQQHLQQHQQQHLQQHPQQHPQQQHGQHPSKMVHDGNKPPDVPSPSKHYYPAQEPRRRARPPESKIPQKAYGGSSGRDASPDKPSHRPLHKGYQSQPQMFGYAPAMGFPKTNPMATPNDGKRYQQSSYELPERAPPKRDPREENRPRTCPPERTGPVPPELMGPPPERAPPPGRPGPPARLGPPERIGPPERLGPPERIPPPERPGPPERIPPPDRIGPPERIPPPERMGQQERGPPPERIGPPERLGPPERGNNSAESREQRPGNEQAKSAARYPPATDAGVPPSYPTNLGPRLSDDELLRGSPRDILARYRHAEAEIARLMMDHSQVVRELNRQVQAQAVDQRTVQESHRRLQDESQELRDLCCFLDDDRQKGRKLAREWQRFGRYTASVMRQEVAAYQTKLRQLDTKQHELVKDNLELKELCLYLDEERQGHGSLCSNCGAALNQPRDDGDGSSSSTAADEPALSPQVYVSPPAEAADRPRRTESRERLLEESIQRQRNLLNEHILQYIRGLERRLEIAEEGGGGSSTGGDLPSPVSRPDAVVQAMRVLEVQENLEWDSSSLERPPQEQEDSPPQLEDTEKALLRQMCNVVWRKLEDAPTS